MASKRPITTRRRRAADGLPPVRVCRSVRLLARRLGACEWAEAELCTACTPDAEPSRERPSKSCWGFLMRAPTPRRLPICGGNVALRSGGELREHLDHRHHLRHRARGRSAGCQASGSTLAQLTSLPAGSPISRRSRGGSRGHRRIAPAAPGSGGRPYAMSSMRAPRRRSAVARIVASGAPQTAEGPIR